MLLKSYGYRGWWPLQRQAGINGFDDQGYHPQNYDLPVRFRDKFEIIAGAVLTQNTSWINVKKALHQLSENKLLTPQAILAFPEADLAALIRASGYYNQKARKLKAISQFFLENKLTGSRAIPTRESLLRVWGIGEETADSILLYAYNVPVFVIDAYTERIFSRIGLAGKKTGYAELQKLFQEKLPGDYILFNEYHALIVAHGKDICKTKPLCTSCVLRKLCRYFMAL